MVEHRFATVIQDTSGDKLLEAMKGANDLVITKHLRMELGVDVLTANDLARALRALEFRFIDEQIKNISASLNLNFEATTTERIGIALDAALAEIEEKHPDGLVCG